MDEKTRKEANRLNWIVKGMLIPESESDFVVEQIYHSYFKRRWGNHENGIHTDGFEEAYEARRAKQG